MIHFDWKKAFGLLSYHVTYHSVQEVHITSVFHHHMVTGQIAGVVIPKVHLTQNNKNIAT